MRLIFIVCNFTYVLNYPFSLSYFNIQRISYPHVCPDMPGKCCRHIMLAFFMDHGMADRGGEFMDHGMVDRGGELL